ncbi:MAG: ABC transporter permease [Treponema sp.]|nr:ABC transporter permease [Treponema sp.]
MVKYIFQRLGMGFLTFLVIICVVFFVVYSMPGSPFHPERSDVSPRYLELITARYHLDRSLPERFMFFMADYIRFDFGYSLVLNHGFPVGMMIRERVLITIQLNLFTAFFVIPMGLIFGISMAIKKDKFYDHAASTVVMFFIAAPAFVMASLMQYFLAYRLGWFPILLSPEVNLTWTKFYSMILPILALSFGPIASISRLLRAEMAEILTGDFMLLAKAKGLSFRQCILRHALRNAMVPITISFVWLFLGIVGISVVIERIFGIPGLSIVMIRAISANDFPVIVATIYFYAIIGLSGAIVADMSVGVVDPRIRMGGRKGE